MERRSGMERLPRQIEYPPPWTTPQERFDDSYYLDIWETLHRHDYCDAVADRLLQQYGKCRILDIGTGCGYLVKVLNDRGADAYGLDISEAAVKDTCAPGRVLLGSVTDIPWRDGYFDVVHSNGLWPYMPEKYIDKAVSECYRVGRAQEHNIDTIDQGELPASIRAVTHQTQCWWDSKLLAPRVLVACPTHECKEYAHERWLSAITALDYQNFDILVVDNSPNEDCYNRWKDRIPMIHIPGADDMCVRIAQSMEVIRQHFINGPYKYWFNVEIDVIVPPEALRLMVYWSRESDWTAHVYPERGGDQRIARQSGVGCSLFSRNLMEKFNLANAGQETSPDAWLWQRVCEAGCYTSVEIWNRMKTQHIAW